MGKPFSDLEKRVIAILAGGGNPLQSNDQEVVKYWNWKINPTAASHDLPTTSIRASGRKTDEVNILPFTASLPASQFAKATFSKRAQTGIAGGVKTALAHKTVGENDSAIWLGKFKPAKVYYRTGAAENSVARTSRITGRSYKSYYTGSDEGFTAPFGKVNSTDTQLQRQVAIKAAIISADATVNLISFTPEKFRV